MKKISIVVLISGNGSNLQAIIDAQKKYDLAYEIVAVISNKAEAFGLERASNANLKTEIIPSKSAASREQYDTQLIAGIKKYHPDLIVLAGFMRILTEQLVTEFAGKIINIHPSVLPRYPGLHTHEQVIANQDKQHGCTIHIVTAALDAGPIIAQASLTVSPNETVESVRTKVFRLEHLLYPLVIHWFAEKNGQLTTAGEQFNEETLQTFYQNMLPHHSQ